MLVPALQDWPKDWQITTKPFWSGLIEYINVNYFDQLEAFRVWFLEALLLPVKRFFLALPWPLLLAAAGAGGLAAGRAGGWPRWCSRWACSSRRRACGSRR